MCELSFIDRLYEHQGYIKMGTYSARLVEIQDCLVALAPFLHIILDLSEKSFDVDADEFEKIVMENYEEALTLSDTGLIDMDYYAALTRATAFMRALEIYDITSKMKIDQEVVLKHYLKNPRFISYNFSGGSKVYERVINHINTLSK